MNVVAITGRLANDLELKKTRNDKSYIIFDLAVRERSQEEGADFIRCSAWGASADYLARYAHKGDMIGIQGRLSVRTFDGQNGKVKITEVVSEEVAILNKKNPGAGNQKENQQEEQSNYYTEDVGDLPFY